MKRILYFTNICLICLSATAKQSQAELNSDHLARVEGGAPTHAKAFIATPLKLDSVVLDHLAIPILKRNAGTPVLQLRAHTSGVDGSLTLTRLLLDLSGTDDLHDIAGIKVFYTGNDPEFKTQNAIAKTREVSSKITITAEQRLRQGINYFWISVNLDDQADIKNIISLACPEVGIGGQKVVPKKVTGEGISRLGIALRKHNDDHVDTYRIPGLETTNVGTLIAVYDVRRNSETDLQEDVDIGMSRSTNGGKDWEPMRVIMDMKEWGGRPNRENGIGDPCILVDRSTNTIWVAGLWSHGHPGQRSWNASGAGITPIETSQVLLTRSDDDGLTWSEPINITEQIKDPAWHLLLQGPGKGIHLKDGTLVFPAQFKDKIQIPHSTILWSQDHGTSWSIGTGVLKHTTEAQVIERNNGELMINMRDDRNREDVSSTNGRAVYTTTDLGKSWTRHNSSNTNTLQESNCQASLIKEEFVIDGAKRSLVLFSNPNTKTGRHHMSIKVSLDDGESWDLSKTLLLDEGDSRGYSCMTKVDDHTLGILYEGSQADMTFQLIDIDQLMGKP